MKTKQLVLFIALGALATSARSQVATNFYADFDAATAQNLKILPDNAARASALNAGTTVGSWTNLTNPNIAFKIVDNGTGNKAIVFNDGSNAVVSAILEGRFPAMVDMLGGTNQTTVEFLWMKTDPGGGGVDNAFFEIYTTNDLVAAGLRWHDGTNIGGPIAHSEAGSTTYNDFAPAWDVDKDMSSSAAYNPLNMIRIGIVISKGEVVYKLDANLDGTYELVSTNLMTRSEIGSFKLRTGSNQAVHNQGAWVDGIFIGTESFVAPPPTTNLNLVVNFTGNPTTTGLQTARSHSVSNDTQRSFYFDDSVPFFNGPATNCMKIYGGWDGRIGGTNVTVETHFISGDNGQIVNAMQASVSAATNQLLYLWDKADFLHDGNTKTWGFFNTDDSAFTLKLFRNDGTTRFVIRNGSTYYVSQKTFVGQGTFVLTGAEGVLWAAWDPTAGGGADFYTLPTTGFDTAVFSNVTAVGLVCVDNMRGAGDGARFTIYAAEQGFGAELVEIAASGYDLWAADYPTLTGGQQDDDDLDGLVNLYEYALGGDPTNGFVDGEIPVLNTVPGALNYIHAQRSDDASLSYYLELTGDLVFPAWTNSGYTVLGTYVTGGTFNYVTNQIPTTDPKKFIRLMIDGE